MVSCIMTNRDKPLPSSSKRAEPAANLADMAKRAGVRTVAAAWPTGLARLGEMVTACERCDAADACRDWLARAPKGIDTVPAFCPNAAGLHAARKPRD